MTVLLTGSEADRVEQEASVFDPHRGSGLDVAAVHAQALECDAELALTTAVCSFAQEHRRREHAVEQRRDRATDSDGDRESPLVHWPDPSPLQSWWDHVMKGGSPLAKPHIRRAGRQRAHVTVFNRPRPAYAVAAN